MMVASGKQKLVPGLIGVAVRTDQAYYAEIHSHGARELAGGRLVNSMKTCMVTIDFVSMIERLRAHDRSGMESEILEAAYALQRAGADFIVLTANTFHAFLDRVRSEVTLPILNVVDGSCDTALALGFRKLGILSTSMTIREGLYQTAAAKRGIATVLPSQKTIESVDNVIFSELISGVFSDAGIEILADALRELHEEGADCALLACTDMTHVADRLARSPIPIIDTTRLHALYAAKAAYSGQFDICSSASELGSSFIGIR